MTAVEEMEENCIVLKLVIVPANFSIFKRSNLLVESSFRSTIMADAHIGGMLEHFLFVTTRTLFASINMMDEATINLSERQSTLVK